MGFDARPELTELAGQRGGLLAEPGGGPLRQLAQLGQLTAQLTATGGGLLTHLTQLVSAVGQPGGQLRTGQRGAQGTHCAGLPVHCLRQPAERGVCATALGARALLAQLFCALLLEELRAPLGTGESGQVAGDGRQLAVGRRVVQRNRLLQTVQTRRQLHG